MKKGPPKGAEGGAMEVLFVFGMVFVVGWIVPMFLAMSMWKNKGGGGGAGFALGFFLGWLGVLIAAIASPSKANHKSESDVVFHNGFWWTTDAQGKPFYRDTKTNEWIEWRQGELTPPS